MRNCHSCGGTGRVVHPTWDDLVYCKDCNGRGYFGGQLPITDPIQTTPTQEAKPVNKMLTIAELEKINELLEDHARIMNDMRRLDEALIAAAANLDATKTLRLSIIRVELRNKGLAHFGIAIRAILVQQEMKIRRKLAQLNFHLDAPDAKDMPYYHLTELEKYADLAQMMGKSFFED